MTLAGEDRTDVTAAHADADARLAYSVDCEIFSGLAEMSMLTSAMASTAAGFTAAPESEPVEPTSTPPHRRSRTDAAAELRSGLQRAHCAYYASWLERKAPLSAGKTDAKYVHASRSTPIRL